MCGMSVACPSMWASKACTRAINEVNDTPIKSGREVWFRSGASLARCGVLRETTCPGTPTTTELGGTDENLGIRPGERKCFQKVKVTRAEKLQGNLSVTWTEGT